MIIQISSGQGPAECELAVGKLLSSLQEEYSDIEIISIHRSKHSGEPTSVMFSTDHDLSALEGSIQWICKSPYRPHHGRKNWFVDVSIIPEAEPVDMSDDIKIEAFHCGGKGGQNVNKVETGIRVSHIPTGISVTSTKERSQYMNKQDALKKLSTVLKHMEINGRDRQKNDAWREHNRIVRGNPVRVYEGMKFMRIDQTAANEAAGDRRTL